MMGREKEGNRWILMTEMETHNEVRIRSAPRCAAILC